MASGPLRETSGFYYQEFTNLRSPIKLKGDTYGVGEENKVSVWAEYLTPEKAKALAYYEHPVFGRYGDGTEMLSGEPVFAPQKITLEAWDLAVIRER